MPQWKTNYIFLPENHIFSILALKKHRILQEESEPTLWLLLQQSIILEESISASFWASFEALSLYHTHLSLCFFRQGLRWGWFGQLPCRHCRHQWWRSCLWLMEEVCPDCSSEALVLGLRLEILYHFHRRSLHRTWWRSGSHIASLDVHNFSHFFLYFLLFFSCLFLRKVRKRKKDGKFWDLQKKWID